MHLIDKALWQIESNLFRPMTLERLSAHCAVSKFHLVRSFRAATGYTPMTYLRARRLSVAAQTLAQGHQDILGLALDLQYQSHEAFTRAFLQLFGTLPIDVRKSRSTETLSLLEPIRMKQDMIIDLVPPKIIEHPAFKVVGIGVNSSVENTSNIPPLWQELGRIFQENDIHPRDCTFGVCIESEDVGKFRYVAGLEPSDTFETPDAFETVEVPAATYAVFTHRGHISDIGRSTYTLWNKGLPDADLTATFTPNFERYDHRSGRCRDLGPRRDLSRH